MLQSSDDGPVVTDSPTREQASERRPSAEKPSAEKPSAEKPSADEQATAEPVTKARRFPRVWRRRLLTRISIQSKLVVMMVLCTVVAAAVVGFIAFHAGRNTMRTQVFSRLHVGDVPAQMTFIVSGRVRVAAPAGDGSLVPVTTLNVGSFLGQTALTRQPVVANAQALGEVTAVRIGREYVEELLQHKPSLLQELGRLIEDRRSSVRRALAAVGE